MTAASTPKAEPVSIDVITATKPAERAACSAKCSVVTKLATAVRGSEPPSALAMRRALALSSQAPPDSTRRYPLPQPLHSRRWPRSRRASTERASDIADRRRSQGPAIPEGP